ncbi:MAG TPA: glycosyltransferase family A protein [Thermoanaerobaculia bacterium]|nr:glycosyltransferase family A protein [Thermoanaerobaculia bacterium]
MTRFALDQEGLNGGPGNCTVTTISVIIPTYNYGRFLCDAIDSALAQTCPALEVIVVDDGSTDDTPRILADYGGRIRVIHQKNLGVSAARNAGITAARGEYLSFLDSDDIWRPRKLECDVARLAADPTLGMVHCGAETFDNSGRTLSISLTGLEGWIALDLLRLDREVIAAPGSNVTVRRAAAEEAGGYDPGLQQAEDWDFCYRIACRYRAGFVPEVLVRYRQHGSGNHHNIPRMEKNMLKALEKAFQSPDPAVQSLRRHAYGSVHRILAGCYFESREPLLFLKHVVRSLRYDPRNLGYFAAYPLRAVSRASSR